MLFCHLQVVLSCDLGRIPDPCRNDVLGPLLGKFCLAGGSQVLPRLRPWLNACAPDDLAELGAEILCSGTRYSVVMMKTK
ncbi:MAG: hypothetical protein QGI75_08650 [Phycisphaerales bacterium]|nr:hypothetical protein [Phycisphaerales bacterium]MDP6987536.1 hypothetical protein [Phycisphaerales bacterium]